MRYVSSTPPQCFDDSTQRIVLQIFNDASTHRGACLACSFDIFRTNGLRGGGEFKVVGQVDNTDLADGRLHVGEVNP